MAAAVFARLGIKRISRHVTGSSVPELPRPLAYLWEWFGDFVFGLPSGGMGPAVATWESLEAWTRQMRVELEPWEARAMIRLGHLRAVVQSEADAERQKAEKNRRA
ncbi:MAG: hypothetical protein J0H71_05540 [Rhizobiales bacterium]|nr:hypothetical protein [Hyphomicrobiales bacterium]